MDQFSERLTFWFFLWKWELPGLQQKVDIYSLQHLEKAKKEKKDSILFSFYLLWCSKQWIVELMLREFSIMSPVMSQWTSMNTRVRQENFSQFQVFVTQGRMVRGLSGYTAAKSKTSSWSAGPTWWMERNDFYSYYVNFMQSCCTCMTSHICANTQRTHTSKWNNLLLIQNKTKNNKIEFEVYTQRTLNWFILFRTKPTLIICF